MKNLYLLLVAVFCFIATTLVAQVPQYNSYPSAKATVFLDFDGQTVNGTGWNAAGTIYAAPSNLKDAQVLEIFERVAEDYRPFNINITTDSAVYWKAPVAQRMRVILTITWEWYGKAGGVSYTNSFTWGDNTPCFIFTSLLNYNTKNIAEAASHEVGHTLGLRHQSSYDASCARTEEYNSGTGGGEIGWAPIMGVGYYRNRTVWHKGSSSSGCKTIQDDLAVITSTTNGFGYRPTDNAGTFSNAPVKSFQNNRFTHSGLISGSADVDMYQFKLQGSNRLRMSVVPNNVGSGNNGSNLDVELKLYNGQKKLIATYNPPEVLSASIDTTLPSGTYYYSVSGAGNTYATNYASMGEYTVEAALPQYTILALRQLTLKGATAGDRHQLSWNIDADEAVVKQVLEVSANGRDFQPLTQPATDARAYAWLPTGPSLLYRLSVTFDDGKQYYSNIIALRAGTGSKRPHLLSNLVQSNGLMVSSPAAYAYTITDLNGRLLGKGAVTPGTSTLQTGYLPAGLYLIRFSSETEQWVEKFTRP